jgi:hypothetical protein
MKHLTFRALIGASILASAGGAFAAGQATQPSVCSRSCWGARAPQGTISQMSALNRAVIHHTAQPGD